MDFAEAIVKIRNHLRDIETHERNKDVDKTLEKLGLVRALLTEAAFDIINKNLIDKK
jgi:hypothetical protein